MHLKDLFRKAVLLFLQGGRTAGRAGGGRRADGWRAAGGRVGERTDERAGGRHYDEGYLDGRAATVTAAAVAMAPPVDDGPPVFHRPAAPTAPP